MNKLIEAAKKNGGFTSDYQLAKAINASTQLISNWQRGKSKPNGLFTVEIIKAGNLKLEEAIKVMRNGYATVSILVLTALASIASLASFMMSANCILCKIDSINKIQNKLHFRT